MTSSTEEESAAETRVEGHTHDCGGHAKKKAAAAAAAAKEEVEEGVHCWSEQPTRNDSAIASRESSITLLGDRDSSDESNSSSDDDSCPAVADQAQHPSSSQVSRSDSGCMGTESSSNQHAQGRQGDKSHVAPATSANHGEQGVAQADAANQDGTRTDTAVDTVEQDQQEQRQDAALSLEEAIRNPGFEVLTRGEAEHAPLGLPLNKDMREEDVEYPTIAVDADQERMRQEHAAKVRANPKLRRIAFCPAVVVVSADERIRTPLRSHVADIVAEKMDQFRFKHRVQSTLRTVSRVIAQKTLSSQQEPDDTAVTTRMRKSYSGMDTLMAEIHSAMTARDQRQADREAMVAAVVQRRIPVANNEWGTPQPALQHDGEEEEGDDDEYDDDDFVVYDDDDDDDDDSDDTLCASDFDDDDFEDDYFDGGDDDDDIFVFGNVCLADSDGDASDATITPDDE